jgi:hypothetical protein
LQPGQADVLLQHARQPGADVVYLLLAQRVLHRILMPFDIVAQHDQQVARLLGALQWNDRVGAAVGHEDRRADAGGIAL